MPRREVVVRNELGVHARPAVRLVECANRQACDVLLSVGDRTVNGKSVMGVLMLASGPGTVLAIETRGAGEEDALEELCRLVEDGFGET